MKDLLVILAILIFCFELYRLLRGNWSNCTQLHSRKGGLHSLVYVLRKIAGLPDIRFHDLRHTAATIMLQQNVHPKVVQEPLGHSDISLTLNAYLHVMLGMEGNDTEKIDEVLTTVDVKDALMKRKTEQVKK